MIWFEKERWREIESVDLVRKVGRKEEMEEDWGDKRKLGKKLL